MNKKVLVGVIALLVVLGGVLLFYFGSGDLMKGSIRRGGFERGGAPVNSRGIVDPSLNFDEYKDSKVDLDKTGTLRKAPPCKGLFCDNGGDVDQTTDLGEEGAVSKGSGGCKGKVGC